MRKFPFVILLALISSAQAVELRVASFNIGAHFATSYFDYSLGDPGTVDYESVKAILDRMDADVVALQEIHSVDLQGSPDDLESLAAALGYPFIHVPPTSNVFDTSLRVVILSRFPFLLTQNIGSPAGAKEITRLHPVVKVDVPGTTNDPVIISTHLKAGTTTAERFRRAVEMKRLVGYINASGMTNDDNYIILGDFNPSSSNTSISYATYLGYFNEPDPDLPGSYVVGTDVIFPVAYSTNPLAYFSTPTAIRLDPRQLNNSASTYGTTFSNGPTLDLILVSPAIAARPKGLEVYNSSLDTSNISGLPKVGSPLADNTSAEASDHYAVFADLEMDSDFPNLDVALTNAAVTEGHPDGTASFTVTLPVTKPSAVTVAVASDDPGVVPVANSIVIPAGSLSGSVAIRSPRNFIAEGQRTVTFTATATGYDPDNALLQVNDGDGTYIFTTPGQTLLENFSGFEGNHDPSPWISNAGSVWLGMDSGASGTPGFRAYGAGSNVSPGFLGSGAAGSLTASFLNQSAKPMTALRITLDASQWRSASNGAADFITAELVMGGATLPLSALTFMSSQALPPGAVTPVVPTTLTATATGLHIPPGASFDLRVRFNPGSSGGVLPSDVFINEFHYDNTGPDTGEFVEIAVAPGFEGQLADLSLVHYNGSNGLTISSHALSSFVIQPKIPYQHQLIHKMISGLQNDHEGFAIVSGSTVLSFISYEGQFTATNGPAMGMTSVNINVTQSGNDPVGYAAVGLFGTGGSSADFTWKKFTGIAHSPGAVNDGQTFSLPILQPQGIAIDNVTVVYLSDNDLDGIPDETDADDDNDLQADADELAFGTNPYSAGSRFVPVVVRAGQGLGISFLASAGKVYTVESSGNLQSWQFLTTVAGNGQQLVIPLPTTEDVMFFRVRAPIAQ